MNRITIIGLGWLGERLGVHLNKGGYNVSGTTSTPNKLTRLSEIFTEVSLFSLETVSENIGQVAPADVYIITIPPSVSVNYSTNLAVLLKHIKGTNSHPIVIYTSSTSVYGDQIRNIDELSELSPETSNAKKIVEFENILRISEIRFVLLRLGGLCGENRHPIHSLSGRKNIKNPLAPVNLVHSEDICQLVELLLRVECYNKAINMCSPIHPTKIEYYLWAAKKIRVDAPSFNLDDSDSGKVINSIELPKLDFQFKYTSPFDYL